MPRIAAENIAAHVAQQEAAVFDTAIRLFVERGYDAVSLADIAAEVGLARTSLYRYVPDKAHLLLRWLRRELPIQIDVARQRLNGEEPPIERIQGWAIDQLDYALRPEHRLIAALPQAALQFDEEARGEIADSHRQLQEPLMHALADAGVTDAASSSALATIIGGMTLAIADRESRTGEDESLREHLLHAIAGVVSPPPPGSRVPEGLPDARAGRPT